MCTSSIVDTILVLWTLAQTDYNKGTTKLELKNLNPHVVPRVRDKTFLQFRIQDLSNKISLNTGFKKLAGCWIMPKINTKYEKLHFLMVGCRIKLGKTKYP